MRLTEKTENGYAPELPPADPLYDRKQQFIDAYKSITNKLGQLEDIEEELGIDLLTLFKALKNGVYYRDNQREINFAKKSRLSFGSKTLIVDRHTYKYLTDYGKTWALTKGELL